MTEYIKLNVEELYLILKKGEAKEALDCLIENQAVNFTSNLLHYSNTINMIRYMQLDVDVKDNVAHLTGYASVLVPDYEPYERNNTDYIIDLKVELDYMMGYYEFYDDELEKKVKGQIGTQFY